MTLSAQQIEEALAAGGVSSLPASAGSRFAAYLELLLRWNARLNLTAIRLPEEIVARHFVECAFAAQHLPSGISTLLDFGSGAGFPGIPIAIFRPEIHVTLAESHAKKAAFLSEAVRVLEISTEVYRGRVESMPAPRTFDCVGMRAVDKMAEAVVAARSRADRTLALLTTAKSGPGYQELAPEFTWGDPIPLPHSLQSILLIGQRTGHNSQTILSSI